MKCTCCQHAIPPICTCSKAETPLDLSKPLMLSSGEKVIGASIFRAHIYVLYVSRSNNNVFSLRFNREGKSNNINNSLCLINVPEERYAYINVYPNYNGDRNYPTREMADDAVTETRIGCIKVKVEARFDD